MARKENVTMDEISSAAQSASVKDGSLSSSLSMASLMSA